METNQDSGLTHNPRFFVTVHKTCSTPDPTTRPTDPVTAEPRHADEPPETSSSGGGDDGNNHGNDDGDTELERLRDQPSETIDDVRQVNEELPSHYTEEHTDSSL